MKKLILSALMALSCGVLFAADTDMYLYWMIDDAAKFGGETLASLYGYTARINNGSGQYLNLYNKPIASGGTSQGSLVNGDDVFGWEMVAGIGDYSSGSFFVELVKDNNVAYESEKMSYAQLASYMSPMMGQAKPADAYGFSTFTAVPEPTSGLLLLLGVAGLALRRKKMQKA